MVLEGNRLTYLDPRATVLVVTEQAVTRISDMLQSAFILEDCPIERNKCYSRKIARLAGKCRSMALNCLLTTVPFGMNKFQGPDVHCEPYAEKTKRATFPS